jgi:FkbM family methyltransferase
VTESTLAIALHVAPTSLAEVQVVVDNLPIRLLVRPGTMDDYVVREVIRSYQVELLAERLRSIPRPTVFDVGGHIGSFAVMLASLVPNALVQVFEPVPANYEMLRRNIAHAGLRDRVHARQAAVGGRPGFVAVDAIGFSPDMRNTGGHSVQGSPMYEVPPGGVECIEVVTLGDAIDAVGRVDLLKIDCEGGEFESLYGLTADHISRVGGMVGEIHSCDGFVGTTTDGMPWNGAALKGFLARHYDTIESSHQVQTASALLEVFHATRAV